MNEDFELYSTPIMEAEVSHEYELGYQLFSEAVDELSETVEELSEGEMFTEAKVQRIKKSIGRSKDLTRDVVRAHDNTTKGLGDMIYGTTKLSLKMVSLASKVIGFVCRMIGQVPLTMVKMIDDLGRVTTNSFNGLTGKMSIYITADSVELFNKEIKREIERFISICSVFTAGKDWIPGLMSEDFKRYKEMKKISLKLSGIRYEPTTVNLKSDGAIATYFDPESNYYQQLTSLNKFFQGVKPELLKLQAALDSKIADTENNGSYFKLSSSKQMKVQDSIKMVSSFSSVVGKYFKYLQRDLMTIENHIKRLSGT